jgi:hypothetical protein
MKLRKVLQEQSFEQEFKGAPIVYQFSSLGSLDEKWLSELSASMQAGSTFEKEPLGHGATQFIWPTVEDIRCSLEVLECNKHRTHPSSSSTSAAWITTHAFKSFDNAAGLCCRQCSSKSTKECGKRFFVKVLVSLAS